jgi:hypothetical protein
MGQLIAYARMTGVVPPWSKELPQRIASQGSHPAEPSLTLADFAEGVIYLGGSERALINRRRGRWSH